jgi:hypothetical protein
MPIVKEYRVTFVQNSKQQDYEKRNEHDGAQV